MAVTQNRTIRDEVKEVYSKAAVQPQAGLCCPKPMPGDYTSHIPNEAFDHNYGCGSPVLKANIKPGDTVVDLGSGVGIDCFVAAKLVGSKGRVIGIDMTNDMLSKAYTYSAHVAKELEFDVVEFKKGLIEALPLEDNSVDVLVSNCVLNLAQNKEAVFSEIFRVLKHGGRMVISDIVSERDIAPEDQEDKTAWAECTTGSMSLPSLLESVKNSGFISISQLDEQGWREVKGYHLASVTLEAVKYQTDCHAKLDHLAIYLGPYLSVKDDLGNEYHRFKPTAIRSDVASYLRKSGSFTDRLILIQGKAASTPDNSETNERRSTPCCNPEDKVTPCCENNEPKADGSPCCDPYAVQQAPDCSCMAEGKMEDVSKTTAAAASAGCCDSSSGCGTGSSGCGDTTTNKSETVANDESCCACEEEAEQTGTECCGTGCNVCGCES